MQCAFPREEIQRGNEHTEGSWLDIHHLFLDSTDVHHKHHSQGTSCLRHSLALEVRHTRDEKRILMATVLGEPELGLQLSPDPERVKINNLYKLLGIKTFEQ